MEEDESSTYLKYLTDGSSYLLQTGNEEFSVEPIFTEIEGADWSSETFPILLSAPLTNDEEIINVQESTVDGDEIAYLSDCLDNSQFNGTNTYTITYSSSPNNRQSDEIIQLLNVDGSVTTINKNNLSSDTNSSSKQPENPQAIEDFFSEIKAKKCNLCKKYLCESLEEIGNHLTSVHNVKLIPQNGDSIVGTKMTSILNGAPQKRITMYLCSECGSGYSNKEDLKQHMISQHKLTNNTNNNNKIENNEENTKRNEPVKVSSKLNATNLLKKQQRAMKKIKCGKKGCVLRFAREELKNKHEECHVADKKQFQCPECQEKFSVWRICCMHLWRVHSIDLGLITCPICEKFKSNSVIKVVSHMGTHGEERPFICGSCGKGFKQTTQLRNHEILHNTDKDKLPNWLTERQCEFCDRYFANSKILKKHIASVHDKFKPFICNICGHKTTRKAMLQLHYRQHTGDKPHKCLYCDYKTGDHNCLRRHTMRHFGVARYSCSYCDYQAIQSTPFKMHMLTKHPGKKGTFKCEKCPYTSVNETHYLSHVKCHELDMKETNNSDKLVVNQDYETQNFLTNEQSEDPVDTGGITIPAGFELEL